MEIVLLGLVLLTALVHLAAFDGSSVGFTLNVIWVVMYAVVIALLFQAIKTENSILALPHLVFQASDSYRTLSLPKEQFGCRPFCYIDTKLS